MKTFYVLAAVVLAYILGSSIPLRADNKPGEFYGRNITLSDGDSTLSLCPTGLYLTKEGGPMVAIYNNESGAVISLGGPKYAAGKGKVLDFAIYLDQHNEPTIQIATEKGIKHITTADLMTLGE